MQRVNVDGTRRLLKSAAAAGVRRAVVTGSALAIGVNRQPAPLDETASWSQHAFDLPYANLRRQVELDALARQRRSWRLSPSARRSRSGPTIRPARRPTSWWERSSRASCRAKLAVGFGCLDVRDFAAGMVLAGERGRPGERYLLSGENVTADQLVDTVAAISGVGGPRFTAPVFLAKGLVSALGLWGNASGKPPPITSDVLQILGRYAWYNTTKARTELGWTSRSLHETLTDTIRWLRAPVTVYRRTERAGVTLSGREGTRLRSVLTSRFDAPSRRGALLARPRPRTRPSRPPGDR